MKKETLALLLNFVFFVGFFVFFKNGIGTLVPMSYVPLVAMAALFTAITSPKFLVNKGKLYMKLPFIKQPIELF
jgi:hypothetical protein